MIILTKDATTATQFVTLGVDSEVFAVPVEDVVEILDMRAMSRIPEAPIYLAGLIDWRGRGVPVIDLRLKFGLTFAATTEHTRILVLEVPVEGRRITFGLVAERVFEVMALDPSAVEPPPDIGVAWRSDYIRGIGRRGDGFVVILNLQKLLSTAEVAVLANATPTAAASA